MPILLDTNVYVFAMRSDEGAEFFRRRFRPLVFQTHVSSIVIEELYAGALDAGAMRLVERYLGALERAGRVITPTADEWKEWIGAPGMTYQVAINAKTDRAKVTGFPLRDRARAAIDGRVLQDPSRFDVQALGRAGN